MAQVLSLVPDRWREKKKSIIPTLTSTQPIALPLAKRRRSGARQHDSSGNIHITLNPPSSSQHPPPIVVTTPVWTINIFGHNAPLILQGRTRHVAITANEGVYSIAGSRSSVATTQDPPSSTTPSLPMNRRSIQWELPKEALSTQLERLKHARILRHPRVQSAEHILRTPHSLLEFKFQASEH
jgi:hypothetical protein